MKQKPALWERLAKKIVDQKQQKDHKLGNHNKTNQKIQYGKRSYFMAFWHQKKNNSVIWFSGIFKEFSRISWLNGNKLWSAFFVVLVILVLGSLLFFLVAKIANLIN